MNIYLLFAAAVAGLALGIITAFAVVKLSEIIF
jgi:hypothetical protein